MQTLRAPARPLRRPSYPVIAATALAAIVAVRIAREVAEGETLAFDTRVIEAIHAATTPAIVTLAWLFTDLGPPLGITIVVALTALALWRSDRGRDALIFIAGFLISASMVSFVKTLFDRARPDLWPRPPVSGDSFPSGHAVESVVVYGTIAWLASRADPARRPLYTVLAVLLIIGIALSRAVLGVHWPTDLLAGLSLGIIGMVGTVAAIERWGTDAA